MNKLYLFTLFTFVLATSALSQGPVKELEIEINGNPHTMEKPGEGLTGSAIFDVNGDGVRDLAILSPRDPASGQATSFLVKSGNSSQTWEYPITNQVFENITIVPHFLGFFELNNNSPEKEALFARKTGRSFVDPVILNQEASFNVTFNDVIISSIADIDDDGIEELYLYNKQTGLLEIWGPGPKLEMYPSLFSVETARIDPYRNLISYFTTVNGEKRNVHYNFLENSTVDISIQDENSNILLNYNSADDYQIPEGTDEAAAWLATQNIIKNTSVGIAILWNEYKGSFSEEAQTYASNGLAGIGGILGSIPGIIDAFCRAGGTATCTDDFSTVTINCDCGVPTCITQQVAVTVMIVEKDPNTGETTQRDEIQYKDKCVCTCVKLKDIQG